MQDIYTKILSSKKFRKFGIPIILFILVGASFFVWTSYNRVAEANWWDEKWIYRNSIQVTNNTTQESNVYVEVTLDTSGLSIQNDCGDFRFTTNSGTQLPYYIVSGCGTATNVIHINFSSLIAGSQSIYFYYGNSSATNGFSASDFSTVASNYTIGSVGTQEVGPGPVAYWKFDEAMGTLANDESGQGHSGAISADNWGHGDDCLVGDCLAMNSISDGVDVANSSKLNPKNITVQAWLKSTSTEGSIIEKKTTDYGDGSDGPITISSTRNINTNTIAAGRTCADGISYSLVGLATSTATTSSSVSSDCLSSGDKVMIINLQGTESNHGNVGNYEFLTIESVSGTVINFVEEKVNFYGNATSSDDTNIGTSTSNQKVMIQRVPQYTSVIIQDGASLVTENWNGLKGGVLAFFSNSGVYVKNGSSITVNSLGYRGGSYFEEFPGIDPITPHQGESYGGIGGVSTGSNLGGVGSIRVLGTYECGNLLYYGGAGHSSDGSSLGSANGGLSYGSSSLDKLYLGSGGHGDGSGAIYVKSNIIDTDSSGFIRSSGSYGGSGGSIYINSKKLFLGNDQVDASGSSYGSFSDPCWDGPNDYHWATSSEGYIHIKSENISGTTTPEATTSSIGVSSTSPYKLEIINNKAVFSVKVEGVLYSATSTIDINDNEYHFVTGTYDGETIQLYINGYLDSTNTIPSGDIDSSEANLAIGYGFEYGFIDEVKIYPYATDAEKVLLDYNSGTYLLNSSKSVKVSFGNPNVQTSNPVGYWALDEGSGTKASDHTIENNHGIITGSSWELEASCLVGQCLSMSSVNDEVVVSHHKTLSLNHLTTSAWIKTNNSSGDILTKKGTYNTYPNVSQEGSITTSKSNAGALTGTGSFSVSIPADAEIAIVFASGQISNNTTMFDKLSWDNGTSVDFTSIERGGNATYTFVQALYMTSSSPDWPGTGTTSTLYWSAPGAITYGYNIGVVFYKNVDTDNPIISTQSHRANTVWTSSLSGVSESDMGITAGYNYYYSDLSGTLGGYVDVNYTGYNQTALWETNLSGYNRAEIGIGQELGEGQLYIRSDAYYNFTAIAFALKSSTPEYTEDSYALKLDSGNPIFKLYNDYTTYTATATTAINDNEWHYVVGTYDGSAMKIYVDGTLEDTNTSITGPLDPSDLGLYIGTNFTSAYIDEVKIYPYARVLGQIQADYASGFAGTTTARILAASFGDNSENYKYCVPADDSICGTPFLEFDMDEKKGNTLYNAGSDSANAIFYDGASPATSANWVRALVGHAVKFNNSSEHLLYSKDGADLVGKGMTITGWVNVSDLSSGTYYVIDGREEASPNNGFGLFLQGSNDWGDCDPGDICFWTASTTGGDIAYDGVPHNMNNNKWHHIAATFNKDTYEKVFYVDGIRIGTAIANQGIGDNPDNKITFGKVESGAGSFMIDGFRAYDFLRTPAQIAWDYNKGNPVAYWDFNECQGLLVHNYITNTNHGNISIGATGTQSAPGTCTDQSLSSAWYNGRLGKTNSSMSFDGVDDYIDIGTSSQLTTDCAMTVCAWINPNSIGVNNHILSQSNSAGDESQYFFSITNSNSNSLEFGWGDGIDLEYYYSPESSITTGSWQHVCATRTSGGTEVVLYIDGQSVPTTATGTSAIPTIPQNLSIGRPGDYNGYYFDGKIDEVKLWRYPLTSGQIRTEYNGGTVSF